MAYICAPKWIKVTYQREKKTTTMMPLYSSHTGSVTCKPLTCQSKLRLCKSVHAPQTHLIMIIKYLAPCHKLDTHK